jgi:hypothetical protein
METNWAAQHLETIRTLMERSALYRRALAPISTFVGAVGIIAAVAGRLLKLDNLSYFSLYWMLVGVFALAGSLLLVRRQASRHGEKFWSPPTRRVAQAMAPALLVGLIVGLTTLATASTSDSEEIAEPVVLIWTVLYGLALHSAGFFMPRGIRLLGWGFLGEGLLLFIHFLVTQSSGTNISSHFFMGVIFGATHLACGIYLYFTEPRKSAA